MNNQVVCDGLGFVCDLVVGVGGSVQMLAFGPIAALTTWQPQAQYYKAKIITTMGS